MKHKYLINVLDYILSHEHEDFIDNLSEMDISEHERKLILDWYHDNIGTTEELKNTFRKIANSSGGHIYASAICLQYNIKE